MIEAPQPMFVGWGPAKIMLYNDFYAPMLGDRHPGAFGRAFFDVWPETVNDLAEMFNSVFNGQSVQMDDISLILDRGDGPRRAHFSFSYTPVRDDQGSVEGLFCICNETTEKVLAQQRVENERNRHKLLLRQMPGFVALLSGPDHIFEYVNDAYLDLVGQKPSVGQSVRDVFPALGAQGFLTLLDAAFTEGRAFSGRAIPIQLDTEHDVRFIDLILEPIRDDFGRITGVFAGGYDVTAAEHGLRELRSTERLLTAIVTSSDDAIISKDIDGAITSWNAGAERIFGYRADEVVGRPIAILSCVGREDEMPAILDLLKRGQRIEHFETTRRHKDGSTVYVSLSVSPIHDDQGRVVGASKVARDVSAARRSAEALKLSQDRLQEQHTELLHAARLGELGLMAATLAHEISQPLSAIVNYLHAGQRLIVIDDPTDRPLLGEAVDRAAEQARRAAEVVRRLRHFAKPNHASAEPLPINRILEDMVALAAIDAGRRGVSVSLALSPDAGSVRADRIEVQQVLMNLIRNALEAMDEQPIKILTISTALTSHVVEVAVADTGAGLAPDVREHIFDPFVTTKGDGMGIGLSICRKIVEAHDGRLWVEDGLDGGSVFKFSLPIAEDLPPDSGALVCLTGDARLS